MRVNKEGPQSMQGAYLQVKLLDDAVKQQGELGRRHLIHGSDGITEPGNKQTKAVTSELDVEGRAPAEGVAITHLVVSAKMLMVQGLD